MWASVETVPLRWRGLFQADDPKRFAFVLISIIADTHRAAVIPPFRDRISSSAAQRLRGSGS